MGSTAQDKLRSRGERQQALVEAAFRSIAEKGFEGFRLREVAAEVGIDHSTLYHYFATKEALVAAVVEHATRQFWSTAPAEGEAAARLHLHLTGLTVMIQEKTALFTVLRELDLRATRDAAVRSVLERHEAGWRTVLGELLEQGAAEGVWAARYGSVSTVELIIATVKGVSLAPDRAAEVLGQLEWLLVRPDSAPAVSSAELRAPKGA